MGYWRDVSIEVENASDEAEAFFNTSMSGHLTGYDGDSLIALLTGAGFDAYISEFDSSKCKVIQGQTHDSLPTLSAYAEGVKPNNSSQESVIHDALLRYLNEG